MSISDSQLHAFAIGLATASGIWLALSVTILVFLAERWSTKQDEVLGDLSRAARVLFGLIDVRIGKTLLNSAQDTLAQLHPFRETQTFSDVPPIDSYESIDRWVQEELHRLDDSPPDQATLEAASIYTGEYDLWRDNIVAGFYTFQRAWAVFDTWYSIPKLSRDLVSITLWIGTLLLASLAVAFFSVVTIGSGVPDWVNTLVGLAFFLPLFKAAREFLDAVRLIRGMIDPNV